MRDFISILKNKLEKLQTKLLSWSWVIKTYEIRFPTMNYYNYPVHTLCQEDSMTSLHVQNIYHSGRGFETNCTIIWKDYIATSKNNPYQLDEANDLYTCGKGWCFLGISSQAVIAGKSTSLFGAAVVSMLVTTGFFDQSWTLVLIMTPAMVKLTTKMIAWKLNLVAFQIHYQNKPTWKCLPKSI